MMIRLLSWFKLFVWSGLFLACFVLFPSHAFAEYFFIDSFHSDIEVKSDASMIVTETLSVQFSSPRYGIFRFIPVDYEDKNGFAYSLRISVLSVRDENGNRRPYEDYYEDGAFYIKIGDPDRFVENNQIYVIRYAVNRGIRFFSDSDELYWNVTGNGWKTEIRKATARIFLPRGDFSQAKEICFTGIYGSKDQECSMNRSSDRAFEFTSLRPLMNYEGLSFALSLPKGILAEPSFLQTILWFLIDNWVLLIPFAVLALMTYLYMRFGRDPDLKKTVIALYEPPDDLSPAEIGTLIDETVDISDISAEIIHLAVKGYLTLKEEEVKGLIFTSKDYVLTKTKPKKKTPPLRGYQQKIYDHLFGKKQSVRLSELKNKFYMYVESINAKLYKSMLRRKYFPKNPHTVRNLYLWIGLGIIIPSFYSISVIGSFALPISGIISGLIIVAFSFFMPAKTRAGAEALWGAECFRHYIDVAERYRVKFQENENIFEQYLPYAMAFGIAHKWAKAFDGIYNKQPSWFQASGMGTFSTISFVNSLSNMSQTVNSTLASSPKSSSGSSGFSGGFSGGGFGGGGGGSW